MNARRPWGVMSMAGSNGPDVAGDGHAAQADEAGLLAARVSGQAQAALARMRERWGETWEFAMAPGMVYTAWRKDGRGEPLAAEDPSDLRRLVAEAGDGPPRRNPGNPPGSAL